jgi:hypothetical protein
MSKSRNTPENPQALLTLNFLDFLTTLNLLEKYNALNQINSKDALDLLSQTKNELRLDEENALLLDIYIAQEKLWLYEMELQRRQPSRPHNETPQAQHNEETKEEPSSFDAADSDPFDPFNNDDVLDSRQDNPFFSGLFDQEDQITDSFLKQQSFFYFNDSSLHERPEMDNTSQPPLKKSSYGS